MNTRRLATLFFVAFALAAATGCGSDDGSGDSGIASLALRMEQPPPNEEASCAEENGTCNCPRDATARLTLVARDGSGAEVAVDAAAVTWHVDATGPTVEMTSSGTTAAVTAKQDWFDTGGSEGSARLVANYGSLEASMPVAVVINASGSWLATLDLGFSYTLSLRQTGRAVVDTGTGYTGRVSGDALTLAVSGINVNARFTSRTDVSGTYSGSGGLSGTLTCTKQ